MFKMAKKILLALALITSLNANEELSKNEIKQIEQLELFQRANIKVSKAYDVGSLYLLDIVVQGNNDQVFLTKDKKNLIPGDVINTATGEKVAIPADVASIRGKEAFVFGSGTDEYFLFTDPECPYCKKFEAYFPQIEKNVKIRVFFYPLSFHKNAKDLSIYVMSKKTKAEKIKTMLSVDVNNESYKNRKYAKGEYEKLEKELAEQMDVASNLKVQGTPAVFDKDGKKVVWVNLLAKYGIQVK
ncbi:thioredoxin fold domain-containing protein [Poseidonibacter sp.]|uniref:thioredoxin fold domain-containing protein n=1 Tax=Poseidonibacter sp. TaxID=2321188 RepID=UPI003C76F858